MRNDSPDAGRTPHERHTERRSTLRVNEPFPAFIRCRGRLGQSFVEEAMLDNLSAHGLCVRLQQRPMIGESMFVLVRFTLGVSYRTIGPGVAVRGIVVRVDPTHDGHWATAILFTQHRMLFAGHLNGVSEK